MAGSLKEIARLTGVAASSVSRALAGKPGVSAEKRCEILEIAERIGYRPNPVARALRTGRASDLLIILRDRPTQITSYRNHALIAFGGGAFDRVRVATVSDGEPLDDLLRRAAEEGTAGVVASGVEGRISPATLDALADSQTAVVYLDCAVGGGAGKLKGDRVEIDREVGSYQAARLLLAYGSEGVAFFAKGGRRRGDARMKGIERAVREVGASLDAEMVIPVDGDDFAEGYAVALRLLARRRPLRGLFCYNDMLAVGALKAISESGRRVPADIAVVGFDDLSFAPFLTIPLTTVAQPVVPCAEAAIDMALLRTREPERPSAREIFETRLIERDTARWPESAKRDREPHGPSTVAAALPRETDNTNVRRTK